MKTIFPGDSKKDMIYLGKNRNGDKMYIKPVAGSEEYKLMKANQAGEVNHNNPKTSIDLINRYLGDKTDLED